MSLRKQITFLCTFACFLLISCDPGHYGKIFISNQTSYPMTFRYEKDNLDTVIAIPSNTTVDVFHFGGLGEGKQYNCCPCEFDSLLLHPVDTAKLVVKDPLNPDNWNMTNPNKRRFSNKEITCEFVVTSADVQ